MSEIQFQLEQDIMDCWHVTDDLKVLSDYISNDILFSNETGTQIASGLEALYHLKFEKLFNTFDAFLKKYHILEKTLADVRMELQDLRMEQEEIEEANSLASLAGGGEEEAIKTLDDLFDEEEEIMYLFEENNNVSSDDDGMD